MSENYKKILCEKNSFLNILILSLILFILSLFVSQIFTIKNKAREANLINGNPATISVVGESEFFAKPDIAKISISVVTEANTVNEATKKNNEKMNAIIKFIKAENIQEKDIKTINYSVNPRYEYQSEPSALLYSFDNKPSKRILVGYEVLQTLEIKLRDLDKSNIIIEGATSRGANQVGSLKFTFDDESALKDKARKEAILDAKEKAKILADQLNVKLVHIINYYDQSKPIYYNQKFDTMSEDVSIIEELPNIEPGENKINARVTIIYEIK